MASAFLRRKQPFLESKVSGTRHTHGSTASPLEASAAPARVLFHDDAVSECESQDSRHQMSRSASSVSLPESSSTSAEAAVADTKELRPATRKDSTSTRARRKPGATLPSGAPGDKREGERIGELSRKEDEFDFAILLKPSKYEELLDLPHAHTERLSPTADRCHHALDDGSALSELSRATTTTGIGMTAAAAVRQVSSATATSVHHLGTAMTAKLTPSHTHLHGSAKHDPARARNAIIARIKQTGLQVKRLLSLDGKQTLLKVKAPPHVLELGAERLRLRKLRRFDCIWMEFSRELRATFADFDARSDTVRFIDSEKQSIVHALLTSDDGGAGLNEFCALRTKYVVQMFPLHKQDLSSLKTHWVTYWRTAVTPSPRSTRSSAPPPNSSERGSRCSRLVCDVLTQPIDDVAQYFGEKVAFYFAWMEMYTRWLVVPSAVGLVLFCLQVSSKTIDHPLAPLYAIFMALWTSAFLVAWKRRAAALAYRWGTLGYEEDVEVTRPEFYGDPAISTPAHKRYPAWRRTLKYVVTLPTVLGSMVLTLAITYMAFSTRDRLEHDSLAAKARAKHIAQDIAADLSHGLTLANLKRLSALGLDWRFWFYFLVTPMLYGLLIPVLDYVFTKAARAMTNWENHRTESRHRSHLILKVFSFRFIHVFASLYYYAFTDAAAVDASAAPSPGASTVPPLTESQATTTLPTRSDNLLRVAIQLASFMVAGQLWKNVMETLIPFVRRRWRMQQKRRDANAQFSQSSVFSATALGSPFATGASSGGAGGARRRGFGAPAQGPRSRAPQSAPGARMSNTNALIHEQCVRLEQASDRAWEEAELEPYDTFEDYTEMLIQFGYVSFFSLAFPLAPLLALLNNVFELRTDAFKLCHAKQRPIAHKASGIGIWFHVLQLMSVLAVLTNCLHVAFTTSLLERIVPASASVTTHTKVWVAFGAEHALLLLQVAMMLAVPAMPRDVHDNVRREREQAKQESARAMAAKMVAMHAAEGPASTDVHDADALEHELMLSAPQQQ